MKIFCDIFNKLKISKARQPYATQSDRTHSDVLKLQHYVSNQNANPINQQQNFLNLLEDDKA